jgi:hypothetical protein
MKAKRPPTGHSPAITLLFLSFLLLQRPACAGSDDVLPRLGLTPTTAGEGILGPLTGGTPYHEAAYKAFKALPGAARADVVRAGLAWIKAYVARAEFQEAYRRLREGEKPAAPEPRIGADDQIRKMRADTEKSIAEMKKNMAAMDAGTRKQMEAVIQQLRAQMAQLESPQQKEMMRQGTALAAEGDRKRHEEELREWERDLPADPRLLVARRIREFLAASADVDYAARLAPRGDKMVFASEAYEKKPAEWKLCFRAGREATEAARSFARAWLAELENK